MQPALALLGIDVGDLVADMLKALVDLIIPDFGADWVSRVVTWLVAVPDVSSARYPALGGFASDLTAVGYGLLATCFVFGAAQVAVGAPSAAELVKRTLIAAVVLAALPSLTSLAILGTNTLTAEMIRHPSVIDGLDRAFGEALLVGAVTGALAFGLLTAAAMTVLYFLCALLMFKIGLTAALAVALTSGGLVWGLYPLAQTSWLARTWTATVAAAMLVPVAWACVFTTAALLASDTLVFEGTGQDNAILGDVMNALVKPFAAVACFWLAYRAPGFLLTVARGAGIGPMIVGPGSHHGRNKASPAERASKAMARGVDRNRDRFTAVQRRATTAVASRRPAISARPTPPTSPGRVKSAASTAGRTAAAPSAWWRNLASEGRAMRAEGKKPKVPAPAPAKPATPHGRTAGAHSRRQPQASSPTTVPRPRPGTPSAASPTHRARAIQPKEPPISSSSTPTRRPSARPPATESTGGSAEGPRHTATAESESPQRRPTAPRSTPGKRSVPASTLKPRPKDDPPDRRP